MQSNEQPPVPKKKISWLKLLLFGVISFLIILPVTGYVMFGPLLFKVLFPPQYQKDFNAGVQLWHDNNGQAKALIEQGLRESANAPRADRMWLHQHYAGRLYASGEIETADQQTQKGIDLCPDEPADANEASALAHLYQNRGWFHHLDFLEDRHLPDGISDQEKAVALVTKWFGPDHHETLSKTPTLAMMYANTNRADKANPLINYALKAADTNPNVKGESFVFSCDARVKAAEHDYKGAVRSLIKAWKLSDEEDRHRALRDFLEIIEPGDQTGEYFAELYDYTDRDRVRKLLLASNYAELDRIAASLQKGQTPLPDGSWVLDKFFSVVIGEGDNMSDFEYSQRLYELRSWLKQTKSPTARIALANCLVQYAWFCSGSGNGKSTPTMRKAFKTQSQIAKNLLDEDPSLGKKSPRYYRVLSKLHANLNLGEKSYMKMLDECHRTWPNYHNIDFGAVSYISGYTDLDWTAWVTQRADQLGGTKGDELFAQLMYSMAQRNLRFWPREKAGFKQILADFPHSIHARQLFISACINMGDIDSAATAFDAYKK